MLSNTAVLSVGSSRQLPMSSRKVYATTKPAQLPAAKNAGEKHAKGKKAAERIPAKRERAPKPKKPTIRHERCRKQYVATTNLTGGGNNNKCFRYDDGNEASQSKATAAANKWLKARCKELNIDYQCNGIRKW